MRLEQAKRDYYRRLAKEKGFRSRAAFKLQQINNKYQIIQKGSKVLDIGAAPGGWLQVSSMLVGDHGFVLGVDLNPVESPAKNTATVQLDVSSRDFPEKIVTELAGDKADCVLADLSPQLSGIWDIDHFRQIDLCMNVIDLFPVILVPRGSAVMKAFQGNELRQLIERMKSSFERVEISKPNASRKESSEIYLVGLRFTGRVPPRQSEEHRLEHESEGRTGSDESDWTDSRLS
jgi:23S rRNA (uridine2552-2'-O)-methyltransferase